MVWYKKFAAIMNFRSILSMAFQIIGMMWIIASFNSANGAEISVVKPITSDQMIPEQVQAVWKNGYGECDVEGEDVAELKNGLEIKFSDDELGNALYILPCGGPGAYNTPYWVYAYYGTRNFAHEIHLPEFWQGAPSTVKEIYNINWNNENMELSAFTKDRGLADCGTKSIWRWAYPQVDSQFVLVEQRTKSQCDGRDDNFPTVWPLSK